MNLIIPFTKDIKFKTNIGEILSVSLEHEYTTNSSGILGNFIVAGEYKSHEVSINKDHFEHVLPFSVDISNRIDTESVDFAIEDFTYEVVDNDTLRINIEYSVNAKELPEDDLFEHEVEEPDFDNILEELEKRPELEVKEETKKEEVNEDRVIKEEVKEDEKSEDTREMMQTEEEVKEEKIDMETESTILNSIDDKEDAYVTYHIHLMQETDTLESICIKYNTSQTILGEYNDLQALTPGTKLIIPEVDE